MRGAVTANGSEAVLAVEIFSPAGASPVRVEALGLPIVGSAESALADGSVVLEDVCMAGVLWHGGERPVRVLMADATPVLGMALLRGSELRVGCFGGGEVAVETLGD